MLWLSDDDGDPPWWMWIVMVALTAASIWFFFNWVGAEWPLKMRSRLSVLPLVACIYWFGMRLWFWFDKA